MTWRRVLGCVAGAACAALALLAAVNVVVDRDYGVIPVVAVLGDLSWHLLVHGSAAPAFTVRTARATWRAMVADARARLRRERPPAGSLIRRLPWILTLPGGIVGVAIALMDVLSSRATRAFPGMPPAVRHLTGDERGQLVAGLLVGVLLGRYVGAVLGRILEERRASRQAAAQGARTATTDRTSIGSCGSPPGAVAQNDFGGMSRWRRHRPRRKPAGSPP